MSSSCLWVVYTLVVCGALGQDTPTKMYTGYRLDPLSVRKIYFYDLIIAIVEVDEANELINCELVEIDIDEIREETLKNMTSISKPKLLTLNEMITLMISCDQLDPLRVDPEEALSAARVNYGDQINSVTKTKTSNDTIFEILSGTKWCGDGNSATTYFDLGPDFKLDVCCRAHDMCPSKILSNSMKYELTNDSEYTISHCKCDKLFRDCLKLSNDNILADVIGGIYFNLLSMKCLDEKDGKAVFGLSPKY